MSAQATPQAQPGGGRQLPPPAIPAQSAADFARSCEQHANNVAAAVSQAVTK